MVDAVKHDSGSKVATGLQEVVKGSVMGALGTAGLVGAAVGILAGMMLGIGPALGLGILAAGISLPFVAGTGAAVGAAYGVFNANSRIAKESSAYQMQMARNQDLRTMDMNTAAIGGMQQGYMQGQQDLIMQLQQQAQQQMLMEQHMGKGCTTHQDKLAGRASNVSMALKA